MSLRRACAVFVVSLPCCWYEVERVKQKLKSVANFLWRWMKYLCLSIYLSVDGCIVFFSYLDQYSYLSSSKINFLSKSFIPFMKNSTHVVYTAPPPGLVWYCGCLPAPSHENVLVLICGFLLHSLWCVWSRLPAWHGVMVSLYWQPRPGIYITMLKQSFLGRRHSVAWNDFFLFSFFPQCI